MKQPERPFAPALKEALKASLKTGAICAVVMAVIVAVTFIAAGPAAAQSLSLDLGGTGGSATARIFQLLILMTVVTLAPSILVMVTSFTRIIIVFSFVRTAMGTQQTPPNQVLVSLALFLTLFIMMPTFETIYNQAITPLLNEEIDEIEAFNRGIEPARDFMLRHVREQDLLMFIDMATGVGGGVQPAVPGQTQNQAQAQLQAQIQAQIQNLPKPAVPGQTQAQAQTQAEIQARQALIPTRVLIPAFMVSEIRRAFEIGFLVFVPFLVIDMVVASVLMSMGMMMLPPIIIALPFKIIFFVLVDGWYMLVGSLVRSFTG